jgi:hypothetical protein
LKVLCASPIVAMMCRFGTKIALRLKAGMNESSF